MLLHGLLVTFPENGLELYNTLDYWACKELLEVASSAKMNPGDKLQEVKNDAFNELLDDISYRKFPWECIPVKYNLWQIKEHSTSLLDK